MQHVVRRLAFDLQFRRQCDAVAQRGPGDFFGTRQAGLPTLRVGDLLRDHRVMEEARRAAVDWFAREDSRGPLAAYLSDHWAERFGLVGVG